MHQKNYTEEHLVGVWFSVLKLSPARRVMSNLVPGLSMFFNIHKKNQEGLDDFHDVMGVVCDDAHWYA